MSETNRPIWEGYEEYEDKFVQQGSGGGSKKKTRGSDSKTSTRARNEAIEHAQENRNSERVKRITNVVEHFPDFSNANELDKFIEKYVDWVNAHLKDSSLPMWNAYQVEYDFMRSGAKAGGQNVNKVNSAARILHYPTNIQIRNEESRDQVVNKANAELKLEETLKKHLNDWQEFLKFNKADELDTDTVLGISITAK